MSEVTEAGSIFIREGTLLPEAVQLEIDPYMPDWRLVKDLGADRLSQKIHEAGWTFFSLAGQIRATSFKRERQKGVRRAVRRILANPKSERFNALEITEVASRHFLGVPYVTVSARSRHIQESVFLFRAKDLEELGRARLAVA